jgi:hypothetical protein
VTAALTPEHARKLRQAAFAYLHVGLLYEFSVYEVWRHGLLPPARTGLIWLFLALGAGIVALIFWLLWTKQSIWTARIVWGIHALRLPALIAGAFFSDPAATGHLPPAFYMTALVVVLLNLWMLARAGWDL